MFCKELKNRENFQLLGKFWFYLFYDLIKKKRVELK